MSDAAAVVAVALAEVGYREKATNADLDLATANAGTGNWTKYARDLWDAGYYNGNKNGYAWCDVFVDWCFYKVFGKTEGQLMECQTGPLGAACPYSAGYYKAQGRYDTAPRAGDQIFFQKNGELEHTGIVAEVTGITITTVEGNSGDRVAKRTYSRTDPSIAGYGHPRYDGQTGTVPAEETAEKYGAALAVGLHQLAKGCRGCEVRTVQRLLYVRGIRDDAGRALEVDGSFGARTRQAVIKLQRQLFPADSAQWDGVVGARTWTALLTGLA